NRLLSDDRFQYGYDNEGNLIRRTDTVTGAVRQFQWDERNRLVAVIDQDAGGHETQRVLFSYDVFGRRISEEIKHPADDVLREFVYDRDNVLLQFVGPAGMQTAQLEARYLFGPAVDQILAQEDASGNVTWLLTDQLGSIRDVVDNAGLVLDHIIYDSFGNVTSQTHPLAGLRYLFAGREFDGSVGLYYNRARYYDPRAG